mgnify:CR=1 FL=1
MHGAETQRLDVMDYATTPHAHVMKVPKNTVVRASHD